MKVNLSENTTPTEILTGLDSLRKQAVDSFDLNGLPNSKMEAWKYSNINKVVKKDWVVENNIEELVGEIFDVHRNQKEYPEGCFGV